MRPKHLIVQLTMYQLILARFRKANRIAYQPEKSYWFGRLNKERIGLIKAIRETETLLNRKHRYLPKAGKNQWGGRKI